MPVVLIMKRGLAGAILSLVAWCQSAYGLELDALLDLSIEELMNVKVTTVSRYEESMTDSPGNILVFDRDRILERGYRNLEDLLQSLPGVHVQKYAMPGTYNVVTFRGALGNNNFLILQDGVRLSSPAGEVTAIAHNYPLYYAKRVEVLMGPASVIYGADAFAGVINIITMDETNDDLNNVSVSAGNDDYASAYAQLHHNLDNQAYLNAGVHGFRSRTYDFAHDFPELYDDPNKIYSFENTEAHHLYINYGSGAHWQFGLNHASQSNSTDFTARPSFSEFDPNAQEIIRQTTLYGRFDTEFENRVRSTTLLTLMNYELVNDSYFNNLFTGGVPGYKYANSDRLSLNQDFNYEYGSAHLLSGGLVYDQFDIIPRGPDLPFPYDTSREPNGQNMSYFNTTLPIQFFDRDYHNAGVYVQDNWQIDPHWRLITGLRYDDNSFYGTTTNPRMSLIHKTNNRDVYKLLYGQAFLAPGPDQAFTSFGSFSGNQNASGEWLSSATSSFRVPNPDLRPEKIETLEFNYEHWFSSDACFKFDVYYSRIDDVILSSNDVFPDQAIVGAELLSTNKLDNVGSSEIHGADIGIDWQVFTEQWIFKNWATVSYIDGELVNNGQKTPLPMTAPYKITAGSTLIHGKGLLLTPSLYWIDSTYSNQRDPLDSNRLIEVPSYFLMDLLAELKIKTNLSVKLAIYNLLDKKYSQAVHARQFQALNEAPQPGRLFSLSIDARF